MKVLHVMNGASGGAAVSTLDLIESLTAEGVESAAVSLDAGTPDGRERLLTATRGRALFTPLCVWNRKIRARLWKRPLLEAWQLWRTGCGIASAAVVAREAQRFGADLIHTNTILNPEGARAALRLGLPHVWHVRELVGADKPFRLRRTGARLGRYLAHHCRRLVANSESTAACLRPFVPAELLAVVPNGVDVARFARVARVVRERPVVAMVASLSSRSKKHALFIRAAAAVTAPARFCVYGDVPDDAFSRELSAQAERLRVRIEWMGHAPDAAAMMGEIDILVHPNDEESFGRVALEAMAAGCPVVGVAAGGIGEVVEHGRTGLLGPPHDVASLTAHIETLARDPALRARMGDAGRLRAASAYSLEAHVAAMRSIYRAAIGTPFDQAA